MSLDGPDQAVDPSPPAEPMLLSMITQPLLAAELLQHLPARSIASLLGTSQVVATEVNELLPLILRERGRVPGTPLRILGRAETAIFCDQFSSLGQWVLGPSKPPLDRSSCNCAEPRTLVYHRACSDCRPLFASLLQKTGSSASRRPLSHHQPPPSAAQA